MRFLLLIYFLMACTFSSAQQISGVVTEKGTGLPLPFANVFINNTTIGNATDLNGKYLITGEIPETFELVASFVGYETVTIEISRDRRSQITQDFELKAYEDNLTEIELKARKDKNWERNMKKFRDIFLALPSDPYSQEIEIHNPWVVDFDKINPKNGPKYVKASAQEPLKITNKALGYEIDYYLQDFRMHPDFMDRFSIKRLKPKI